MSGEPDVTGTVFEDDASGVARNYAEAFLNVVEKDASADEALDQLDAVIAEVLRPHPRFALLLTSPSVPPHEKDRILGATLDSQALPVLVRFLRVLNQHGRIGVLPSVAREARAIWNKRQNRVPVAVRSAVALDEAARSTLEQKLAGLTGARPIVSFDIDPSLIGGLVVQVGDHIYDASVRSHLEQMRRRLVDSKTQDLRSRNLMEV